MLAALLEEEREWLIPELHEIDFSLGDLCIAGWADELRLLSDIVHRMLDMQYRKIVTHGPYHHPATAH